jgi:hypothetical protein
MNAGGDQIPHRMYSNRDKRYILGILPTILSDLDIFIDHDVDDQDCQGHIDYTITE